MSTLNILLCRIDKMYPQIITERVLPAETPINIPISVLTEEGFSQWVLSYPSIGHGNTSKSLRIQTCWIPELIFNSSLHVINPYKPGVLFMGHK